MKSQITIPDLFYLHARFNLRQEFLYAGTIYTHTCTISIPAGNIVENEKWIYNTRFIFICIHYLISIMSFYIWAWSVNMRVLSRYPWKCFLNPQVRYVCPQALSVYLWVQSVTRYLWEITVSECFYKQEWISYLQE